MDREELITWDKPVTRSFGSEAKASKSLTIPPRRACPGNHRPSTHFRSGRPEPGLYGEAVDRVEESKTSKRRRPDGANWLRI
jgi:hypothetical protein